MTYFLSTVNKAHTQHHVDGTKLLETKHVLSLEQHKKQQQQKQATAVLIINDFFLSKKNVTKNVSLAKTP